MRVLIVEDDETLAMTLRWLVESNGDEVRVCHSGGHAVSVASSFAPDLVLLDLELPDMSGLDVCRKLSALPACKDTEIWANTVHDDFESVRAVRDAGFDGRLTKGTDHSKMMEMMRVMHNELQAD